MDRTTVFLENTQNMEKLCRDDYVFLMCDVPETAGTAILSLFSRIYGIENCRIQSEPLSSKFLTKFKDDVERGVRFFSGHLSFAELIAVKRAYAEYNIKII